MDEISGLGGTYEASCRSMLAAALEWLDAHPDADPRFSGFRDVYGIIMEDNDDAKALSQAAVDAAGEAGATGAMHQAVISAALWIRANGWDAYVSQMTHPCGQVGILKEKLARASEDLELTRKWRDELMAEKARRGAIIAEKVLGWKRYKVSNGQQEAYAPSQQAALSGIRAGCSLSKLVDEAIEQMEVAV